MTPPNQITVPEAQFLSEDRLPDLYREGIAGCRARNARSVGLVLMELVGTLNFDYEEAAMRMFEAYDHCLQRVERRQFDAAQRLFERLQSAVSGEPAAPLLSSGPTR